MKIFGKFFLVIVVLVSFTSCSLFEFLFGDNKPEVTSLTIVNNTSYNLDVISWYDYDDNVYYFGADYVFDTTLGYEVLGIASGSSDTVVVKPGSSPVYFYFTTGTEKYYTDDTITVDENKEITYTLTNATIVHEVVL